jgi:DUF1365 family protein
MHKRMRPRIHGFRYKVYYLCFALSDIQKLANRFLSFEKWNLLGFYRRDHGSRDGCDLDAWMRAILRDHHFTEADGDIVLLTLPRILGYVFNPVSFWFCFDRDGGLRAVLSEVSNTFGEHHSYLSFHDDHRAIAPADWLRAEKVFHVSPFLDVKGYYMFRFTCTDKQVAAHVNHYDDQGLLLATSVSGSLQPLSSSSAIKAFLRYPLMTFKVIVLIHFEAIRLVSKGIRYFYKPEPPVQEVTR